MSGSDSGFKDHFSDHSGGYAVYRPTYPPALFEWLGQIAPGRSLAWDCATGNGQAAIALAEHFEHVIASDASASQIAEAKGHARVRYRIEPAEHSSITPASVDLITVAQAYHWFDHAAFLSEAGRVLKAGGVLSIWTYKLTQIAPGIDKVVYELYENILGNYWPQERRFVENGYQDFHFPWDEIRAPDFSMEANWTLRALIGYLGTWSALRRYVSQERKNPLESIESRLSEAWGDPDQARRVSWPLIVKAYRKPG